MTRDRFLDMLRAIAIVRVVIVHMSGATETLGWPLLAYVVPGMPLVFFVSGSLAHASLDPRRESHRSDASFRRDRLRRLLVPYWAFIATIVLIGVAWDLASEWADDSVRWSMVARSIVPLAVGCVGRSAKAWAMIEPPRPEWQSSAAVSTDSSK